MLFYFQFRIFSGFPHVNVGKLSSNLHASEMLEVPTTSRVLFDT